MKAHLTKRVLSLMLAIAMVLSLAACGGSGDKAAAQADPRTRYAYIIDGQWVHVDVL